ncbi:uncharacterized protein Z518_03803 [Rhinocladiella mackenziei CBS 650.93]|uniref:Uncharacterized protein n=1 Tax=Rhinocladiella mackenziei CBS 650.93 TaxID=1442369 RepID=A0A0D2J9N8_9EURO|nr:uncharacterized protein Z518_03803 [Rhinocladiella mackenziei CBS 650.93]KIX05830.1 hypothetical protein Z518_03803 [Rhinocladiella mackenziei CBS 650.93]
MDLRPCQRILTKPPRPSTSYICKNCRSWSSGPRAGRTAVPSNYQTAAKQSQLMKSLQSTEPEDYYVTGELARTLQSLGFQSILMPVKALRRHRDELYKTKVSPSAAIRNALSSQKWRQIYEEALTVAELHLLRDPMVMRQLFHALGRADVHPQNLKKYGFMGLYSLQAALEAGETVAVMDAAMTEIHFRDSLSKPTFELVKEKAFAKVDDYRALTVYLWHMVQMSQTKAVARENYLMAKELYNMVEPGVHTEKMTPLLQSILPPWRVLFRAADHYLYHLGDGPISDSVQEDLDMALREGVSKWNDPQAAELILGQKDEVQKYSQQWVTLATQAAMAGSGKSCFELAMYFLRKDGWYPAVKPQSATKENKSWIGIEWLALSAALSTDNTRDMTMRYVGLAHLLSENGHADEGHSWLAIAKENLDDTYLDPRGEMIAYVDGFYQHWYDKSLLLTKAKDFLEPAREDQQHATR